MNKEQLFDLVAPIAIYHGTDVCFAEKACKSFRKLKRLGLKDLGKWVGDVDRLPDELDDCCHWAINLYNTLFRDIVWDDNPDWRWKHDEQGCRVFVDKHGNKWFSGDNSDVFAWYETAALIKERMCTN